MYFIDKVHPDVFEYIKDVHNTQSPLTKGGGTVENAKPEQGAGFSAVFAGVTTPRPSARTAGTGVPKVPMATAIG